jgi:two-component system response regulator MtrA
MTTPTRVLVVEDDLAIRNLLWIMLDQRRYRVSTVADGRAALEVAGTGFDLVLLDLGLPGLNGLEVCRQLRARPETARLPIVMLTGRDDPRGVRDGLAAGADDFLTKPFNLVQLMATVERVLDSTSERAAGY